MTPEEIARSGGTLFTIQDHIAQAKEWGEKLPYYPGMVGWRTTCRALAEEVERLQAEFQFFEPGLNYLGALRQIESYYKTNSIDMSDEVREVLSVIHPTNL